MRVSLIANPVSGGGRGLQVLDKVAAALERRFGSVEIAMTTAPGSAMALARKAADDGADLVIAMGGDGTISECASGILASARADVPLAFISTGRGSDFASNFGIAASTEAWVERIAFPECRRIDAGEIRFNGDLANEAPRYFNNIASFGVSGHIASRVNSARKIPFLPGKALFFVHSLLALLTYRPVMMRLTVDGRHAGTLPVTLAVVANGPRFGGGMNVAPMAALDDGLFDIVIIPAMARWRILREFTRIYSGTHFRNPAVIHVRAARFVVERIAEEDDRLLPAEIDGEAVEARSVSLAVRPGALNLAM